MIINLICAKDITIEVDISIKDYSSWRSIVNKYNTYDDSIFIRYLNDLDCTKKYDFGRPMMLSNSRYKDIINEYFYFLIKLDNPILYNFYVDALIKRHLDNIDFETNNPYIKPEDKKVVKAKSKKKSIPNIYIRQETTDLFTGETKYIYENLKNKDSFTSSNPNLLEELNTKKKKVKSKKTSAVALTSMTFSFKK